MTSTPPLESPTGRKVFKTFEEAFEEIGKYLLAEFREQKKRGIPISENILKALETDTDYRLIAKLLQERGGYQEFLVMLDKKKELKSGRGNHHE